MKIASLAFGLALFAGGSALLSAATPTHVTYTAAQAVQGKTLYYGKCAQCHGAKLEGISGPALKGSDANLKQQTVSGVYGYLTVNMPMGNAGGLPKGDYVKLMAFLLSVNGVPASKKPGTWAAFTNDTTMIGSLH